MNPYFEPVVAGSNPAAPTNHPVVQSALRTSSRKRLTVRPLLN
jgi:hypothetical protein